MHLVLLRMPFTVARGSFDIAALHFAGQQSQMPVFWRAITLLTYIPKSQLNGLVKLYVRRLRKQ